MLFKCGMCGFELWVIDSEGTGITICRRCDTSPQGGMQRVGPPNSPGTRHGWFTATFGDQK